MTATYLAYNALPMVPMPPLAPGDIPSESTASALASLSASEDVAIRALLSASAAAHQEQEARLKPPPPMCVPGPFTWTMPVHMAQPVIFGSLPLMPSLLHSPVPVPSPKPVRFVGRSVAALRDNTYDSIASKIDKTPVVGTVLGKRPAYHSVTEHRPQQAQIASISNGAILPSTRSLSSTSCNSGIGSAPKAPKASKLGSKRARYDDDFKEQVVREAMRCPEGARIKPTCSRYPGVEPCQLRKWIQKFAAQQQVPF